MITPSARIATGRGMRSISASSSFHVDFHPELSRTGA
jgi:hypothetical protein